MVTKKSLKAKFDCIEYWQLGILSVFNTCRESESLKCISSVVRLQTKLATNMANVTEDDIAKLMEAFSRFDTGLW